MDEIKKREKKIHILVNNSGVSWGAAFSDFDEPKGWDNLMSVNVKGIFYSKSALTSYGMETDIHITQ